MIRIERIFGQEVASGESVEFIYTPKPHQKRLKGVLLTSNTSLSLSMDNAVNMIFSGMETANEVDDESWPEGINDYPPNPFAYAPNERVLQLDERMDFGIIKGVLTNTGDTNNLSVYFLIQTKEEEPCK